MSKLWLFGAIAIVLIVAIGVRTVSRGGPVYQEIVAVKPGEMVTVQLQVAKSVYVFGYRLVSWTEGRRVGHVTLHDSQSGKLIGRYHEIDAKICPECKGTGEVSE